MNESIVRVSKVFFGWKIVLLSLLYAVPGQYDTSTRLFLTGCDPDASWFWRVLAHGIEKLAIWDSVFYVHGAERGLIYEHEWAFGRGWSFLIGVLTPKSLTEWADSPLKSTYYYGLTGVVIAIASHYLATIVLYYLTKRMFTYRKDCERYARVVATLYALSPAGTFLIAGYAESTFALASFVGLYLRERHYYVFAGMAFALSCSLRGNGVLWGLLFLYDLANLSLSLLQNLTGLQLLGTGNLFFSRKEPKREALRGSDDEGKPEIREAGHGGLGASPQQNSLRAHETEDLFFSRKEPKGGALRGHNEEGRPEIREADPGGLGASPQQNSLRAHETEDLFFSRKEPKGEALRGYNEEGRPEIREADPGGLGASPQQNYSTGKSSSNEASQRVLLSKGNTLRGRNLREIGQGGPEIREADPGGLGAKTEPKVIMLQMVRVVAGGSIIGLMVVGLQLYPYLLFCPGRPWCENAVPSIFGYVQAEYWNVGFLRYWTPNNIPNFVFGAPTLYLLYRSLGYYRNEAALRPLLLVQLVVLVAAVCVYHVQIITRIATCLPAMYWYVGSLLTSTNLTQVKQGKRVVNYFVLWTMAHAILFGAFLPPA
jgi:Gpi18-like mannosyltransferase